MDVDQSYESDTVVTSALKGLSEATSWAIGKFYDGQWADIGGQGTSLGINDDAVGLPVDTWGLETFTVDEYEQLVADMKAGTLVVDDAVLEGEAITQASNDYVTINYIA